MARKEAVTRTDVEREWKIRVTEKNPSDRSHFGGEPAMYDGKGRKVFVVPSFLSTTAKIQGFEVSDEVNNKIEPGEIFKGLRKSPPTSNELLEEEELETLEATPGPKMLMAAKITTRA